MMFFSGVTGICAKNKEEGDKKEKPERRDPRENGYQNI